MWRIMGSSLFVQYRISELHESSATEIEIVYATTLCLLERILATAKALSTCEKVAGGSPSGMHSNGWKEWSHPRTRFVRSGSYLSFRPHCIIRYPIDKNS